METKFHDDGHGKIFWLGVGAYGGFSAIVRCNMDDLPDVLYAVFPDLFEPIEYPERGDDESDDDYFSRCNEEEVDMTIVDGDGIPAWEWTFSDASDENVTAWKLWFAEQHM